MPQIKACGLFCPRFQLISLFGRKRIGIAGLLGQLLHAAFFGLQSNGRSERRNGKARRQQENGKTRDRTRLNPFIVPSFAVLFFHVFGSGFIIAAAKHPRINADMQILTFGFHTPRESAGTLLLYIIFARITRKSDRFPVGSEQRCPEGGVFGQRCSRARPFDAIKQRTVQPCCVIKSKNSTDDRCCYACD